MSPSAAREVVDRLHDAQNAYYGGGDGTALRDLLAPNIVWHVPGANVIAGTYTGHDAVFAYFDTRRAISRKTFRMHLRDVLSGSGTSIAALTDGTAMINGQEEAWSTIGLYALDEDQHRITPAGYSHSTRPPSTTFGTANDLASSVSDESTAGVGYRSIPDSRIALEVFDKECLRSCRCW